MAGPLLVHGRQAVFGSRPGVALALIEVTSLARGVVVGDAMLKKAPVSLNLCRPVSPGKFLTLCTGDVADVEEAMAAGLSVARGVLCDQLILYQVHDEVIALLSGARPPFEGCGPDDALGMVETLSASAALLSADSACKAADVRLIEMRLCDGIGGKGWFLLSGTLDMVQAALLASERATVPGLFFSSECIPRPHEELVLALRASR